MIKILVNGALLIEVLNDRGIFSRELLEPLFATGVRKAASVEDETAAVARFIYRHLVMEREAEDADRELVRAGRNVVQFLGGEHSLESTP